MTRVVFDSNTVVSALLFRGELSWLPEHWRSRESIPFAERVEVDDSAFALPDCRDPKDRMFLALAEAGQANVLVTGDNDLLALQGQTRFQVETPAQYRARFV